MNKDISKTSKSDSVEINDESNKLATRWQRLCAAVLDAILSTVVATPVIYFSGGLDRIYEGRELSLSYSIALGLVGIVVFFLINGRGLVNNGQTVGKKILGIRLVNLDGNLVTIKKLFNRYLVFFLLPMIPVAGDWLNLMNVVFIFGKQKKCLHDYFAGTKVIKI